MNNRELACAAQHFGLWAVSPNWLQSMSAAYNAGTLPKASPHSNGVMPPTPESLAGKLPKRVYAPGDDPEYDPPLYSVDQSGIAFVRIDGQITKGQSSYGGTSSVRTRQALRASEADKDTVGIMLLIDSPGGTVAGTKALSDEVSRVHHAGFKPIVTHAEDNIHSAAIWVGAQAGRVTASAMTEVGSIGTFAVIEDLSIAAEKAGIKVHVISSGEMKGVGVPGTEISDEFLEEMQARVEEKNEFFIEAIRKGRGMTAKAVRAVADGRDWLAEEAKEMGLVDEVMSQDDAVRTFRASIKNKAASQKHASSARTRSRQLAELS